MRRRASILTSAVLVFCGADASAQPTSAHENAVRLFEHARSLVERGDCASAIGEFEQSLKLEEGIGAHVNLGECYEKLGRFTDAVKHFARARDLAVERSDERGAAAAQKVASLDPKLPRLEVRVEAASRAPNLVVKVNGRPVAETSWNHVQIAEPGTTVVTAAAPGRRAWSESISIDESGFFVVKVPELPAEAPTGVPKRSEGWQVAGWSVAAVGVIGLGLGTAFGITALSKHNRVTSLCPRYPVCPEETREQLAPLNEEESNAADLATVFFVAGGVAAAVGVTMLVLAPRTSSAPTTAIRLGPGAPSAPIGATLGGAF